MAIGTNAHLGKFMEAAGGANNIQIVYPCSIRGNSFCDHMDGSALCGIKPEGGIFCSRVVNFAHDVGNKLGDLPVIRKGGDKHVAVIEVLGHDEVKFFVERGETREERN